MITNLEVRGDDMTIFELSLSFPDFKLGDVINPDEFDQNNADVVDKLNEVVRQSNVLSADGYVDTDKLANGSVISVKLADGAVLRSKIEDGAINLSKIDITSLDSRYYTESEIDVIISTLNSAISQKTSKNGDHPGTWHGFVPSDFDSGGQAIDLQGVKADLLNHKNDLYNPHSVTADQIGAYHSDNINSLYADSTYNVECVLSTADSKGNYTTVNLRRSNGTLAITRTLSSPDENMNYLTLTEEYYEADGSTLSFVRTTSITYDSKNKVVGSVTT